jgi:hypothetical protein
MAETATQIQYRQEMILGFEQRQSILRDAVTSEAVIKGNSAVFLVGDSNGDEAVTRGTNGLIPSRADNLNQYTATLTEWHDLRKKTRYNIFAGQGDQTGLMQKNAMGVINRKIDQDILTELGTATNDTGTAVPGSVGLLLKAQSILGYNEVPFDGNIWAVISPGFRNYLMQTTEFASADYVTRRPFDGAQTTWADQPGFYRWMEMNIIVHPKVSGAGTNAEKCFVFHKNAIGHAADVSGMDNQIGYDGEQDYSWARCSMFMGAKLLQNDGIVLINHDASALAAQ